MLVVAPLGVLAGALTTVAGVGGGMLLTLALSFLWDPRTALAVTAPALLAGNLHRAFLLRREIDHGVAARFAAGALPAAFLAGLLAVALPERALEAVLVGVTAVALARHAGVLRFELSRGAMIPAGAGAGALTAAGGAGGPLVASALLSHGLTGARFVATGAAIAIAMHVGRIAAYGAGALLDRRTLLASAALAAALLAGNLIGHRLRDRMAERTQARLTWGALVCAVALAVAGLGA